LNYPDAAFGVNFVDIPNGFRDEDNRSLLRRWLANLNYFLQDIDP